MDLSKVSTLGLAYIGDAVYELLARNKALADGRVTANKMHHATVALVKASAQAAASLKLEPLLSEAERGVWKRGRNASPPHVPGGASVRDYHLATALEALFGYLSLSGETDRIDELWKLALQ